MNHISQTNAMNGIWSGQTNTTTTIWAPANFTWTPPLPLNEDDVRRIFKEELALILDTLLGGKE